jgi:catechol 2,3-dioxygenase-like lactoylglutathione lyase family enzyme
MVTFSHVSLSVEDLDRQRRFYAEAFDLERVESQLELPQAKMIVLRATSGFGLELVARAGSTRRSAPDALAAARQQGYFAWALLVDDLERSSACAIAAGATVVSPPADARRPGIRFAYLKDPEGNLFELLQRKELL